LEGLLDDLGLLSMWRGYIVGDQSLILLVDASFLLGSEVETDLCHE
jgi:hypothetical protein